MEKIQVMVAGLPGAMASAVGEEILRIPVMDLVPIGLSSGRHLGWCAPNSFYVELLPPAEHARVMAQYPDAIVVDFAKPASMENIHLYVATNHWFVAGSAGLNVEEIKSFTYGTAVCGVVDVNMSPDVQMALQACRLWGTLFPGVWEGYTGFISESHQKAKGDEPSATARRIQTLLEKAGVSFPREIGKNRDRPEPHAYHRLQIFNPLGLRVLDLRFLAEGRESYVQGVLKAISTLSRLKQEGRRGEILDMPEVFTLGKETEDGDR